MNRREFVILLPDLEEGPKTAHWEIPVEWLKEALADTEATPAGEPGELDVEAMKNGREVMVRGTARAFARMPCAVTLDPVDITLTPEIFLLLGPAEPEPRVGRHRAPAKAGPTRAVEDAELEQEDAAQDVFHGTEIVLDGFVREFLLLDLPMVVKRSDLPSDDAPANGAPSKHTPAEPTLDPRLQPLAELANRMRKSKE